MNCHEFPYPIKDIHDTLVPKTTANMTFVPFLCCHLLTTQGRPHKAYISLKLRAFYTYLKREKHENKTCKNVMGLGMGV